MGIDFTYPYVISKDTPATAIEVQGNMDSLLTWIKQNYRQLDDSPLMSVQLTPPNDSGNDSQVVTKSYVDNDVLPTAAIVLWAGNALPDPDRWEWCRGGAESTTDPKFVDLYAIIGDTYGSPAAGSFNLPNMQSNVPLGVEPGVFDEGDTGGTVDVVAHAHVVQDHAHTTNLTHGHADNIAVANDTHSHVITNNADLNFGLSGGNQWSVQNNPSNTSWVQAMNYSTMGDEHNHNVTGGVTDLGTTNRASTSDGPGSTDAYGDANDNRPPYLALNYIIRL